MLRLILDNFILDRDSSMKAFILSFILIFFIHIIPYGSGIIVDTSYNVYFALTFNTFSDGPSFDRGKVAHPSFDSRKYCKVSPLLITRCYRMLVATCFYV